MGLDELSAARPDPLAVHEADLLSHLGAARTDIATRLAPLLPARLLSGAVRIHPVRVDRYGLALRLEHARSAYDARLPCAGPVHRCGQVIQEVRAMLARAATRCPRLTGAAMDDAAAPSPDGTRLAFVSTRGDHRAHTWLLDLRTRKLTNLTGGKDVAGDPESPDGHFHPSWSPDGQWIAFGLGGWFQERAVSKAAVLRVRSDGSQWEALTDDTANAGFPSYSADGNELVYRVWGQDDKGPRVLDLTTGAMRVLTEEFDNLPDWSPDGELILFTRKTSATNFDVCTIRPDGTGLRALTSSGANDGHACGTGTDASSTTAGCTGSGRRRPCTTTPSSPTARSSA
ncbi:TolB family protein [Streptomyces sp. NPDC059740]|uniref:TolB family protein n=1 Tax=Streptomyces sp. NPDC059740 TaxID=3346926 RepID=UPI00365027D7